MDPELKPYFDDIRAGLDALHQSMLRVSDSLLRTSACFTAPVTASTGTTEPVLASAGLTEPPALASSVVASPAVAPASPMKTIAMAPASCSTECAAQATPASSTELAHDKDAVEHGICDESKPSPTAELITVSARTAARPSPVTTIQESLTVTPAGSTSINVVAPVTCLTKCPSSDAKELRPSSTPAAAPISSMATVDVIPVLTAAAASDETSDDEASNGAASTVTTFSPGRPHIGVYALVSAFTPSATPSLSSAPTTQVFRALAPINHSRACLDAIHLSNQVPIIQVVQSLLEFAIHTTYKLLSSSWHQEHMQYHTPWPPPCLYLNWCASSKLRPIPWPSFGDLPDCVHLTELRPPLQGSYGEFSVVGGVVFDFPDSLSWIRTLHTSLNISAKFLKEPCTESTEVTWSGLGSRATCAFKLGCIFWYMLLLIELTSEEVFEWLHLPVQHFNGSVPCCVYTFSFALFQWETAWPLVGSANYASNNLTLQRYDSFSTGICFGVKWLNGILLQDCLPSLFLGHVTQRVSKLRQWKIAWSCQLQCSEIANADLKDNLLPDVDEDIIQATFMIVCYWAASVVDCSVFSTRFRIFSKILSNKRQQLPWDTGDMKTWLFAHSDTDTWDPGGVSRSGLRASRNLRGRECHVRA